MGYVILIFILWLVLSYFLKNFLLAAIFLVIGIFVILVYRSSSAQNNEENKEYIAKTVNDIKKGKSETPASKVENKSISTQEITSYEVYHRPKDKFLDNMNYKLYRCRATFEKTKRKRSITLEGFSDNDVSDQLRKSGFIEPFEIERISFPSYTDAQKAALGNIYLGDVCFYDASAILSKKYSYDSIPNPDLIAYATECHLKFSYYIGKKALYDLIFNLLDTKDKIAFFIFCIYRYKTNDRRGNLNKHPYRDLFYTFANNNFSNESFIKSMNKYAGNELRFFGNFTINGTVLHGGSTQTTAYKTAKEFLNQHFPDKL